MHTINEFEVITNEVIIENPKSLTDITEETVISVEKSLSKNNTIEENKDKEDKELEL